jgi:hypothetical protein
MLLMTSVVARDYGLQQGTPDLKSIGPITFGPDAILFVADNASATICAIDVEPWSDTDVETQPVAIDALDARLAAYLGCSREDVHIRDMAVRRGSHQVYLSVMRGTGNSAVPLVLTISAGGAIGDVPLQDVRFSRIAIDDAPAADDERRDVRLAEDREDAEDLDVRGIHLRVAREPLRSVTVTDMAYVDGTLLVAGASNEEFSSTLRRIPFPFEASAASNSLEIYHVSHGRYETASPLRTLVPYGGNTSILASYTCTPVVHFSLADLQPGTLAKGRTVADLGAMNTPIDMVAYSRQGEEYLLVSNIRHPLLKIACRDIDQQPALTEPREPVGVPREALPHQGVTRLANLNGTFVLMLQREADGSLHLRPYRTDSL